MKAEKTIQVDFAESYLTEYEIPSIQIQIFRAFTGQILTHTGLSYSKSDTFLQTISFVPYLFHI